MNVNLMIDLLVLAFAIMIIWGIKPVKPIGAINEGYLSMESSTAYRGILALAIVFHHMTQKIPAGNIFQRFNPIGFFPVAVFFFFSGYGLMKSHIGKDNYCKKFLVKRLPSVLFPYLIVMVLYLLAEASFGTVYEAKFILMMIFRYGNPDPFVPYSWYIIEILVFYILFKILMLIFRKCYPLFFLGGLAWYVGFVIFCHKFNFGGWWHVSSFALVLGIGWAIWEKQIKALLSKSYWVVAPVIWILFVLSRVYHDKLYEIVPITEVVATGISINLFVIGFLLITMKLKIGNRLTKFLGGISLEIYLLQGFFIRYLRSDLVTRFVRIENDFVWCIVTVLGTVLMAYLFNLLNKAILKGYKKLIGA